MVLDIPKTNRRSAYDIELDGQGLHLVETVDIEPYPGAEPPPDAIYSDFSSGMGFSEQYVPGTYGWADGGAESGDGPWGGVDARVPGAVLPSGKITELNITAGTNLRAFRSSVDYNGNLFFFGGRYPVAVSGGYHPNGTFTVDFGSDNIFTEINAAAVFDGALYVGTMGISGTLGDLWKTTDGVNWTNHSTVKRHKLHTVFWDSGGVGAYRLVGMDTLGSFMSVTGDPTVAANWTASVPIAGSENSIVSIAGSAKHLYFCGPTGVFDVDARGHTANLCPDFKQNYVISNGGASIIHDADLHVNVGNGIRRIPLGGARVDEPEHYQPGTDTSDGSPIWGYAAPPSRDHGWLIWPIYNPVTGRTAIMYAKDKRLLGKDVPGPMVWHGAMGTFPGVVTHTRVSSPLSGQSRLWVCTEGATMRIFWMSLPFSGNPYQDWLHNISGHQFAQHGSLHVADGWERTATKRVPLIYHIESENVSSVSKVSVWRRDDKEVDASGDPVYTRKAVAQSQAYESTSDLSSSSVARADFRFDLDGTELEPPVLRGVRIEADVNIAQRRRARFVAVVRNPDVTARGSRQRQQMQSIIQRLRAMEGINAAPMTLDNFLRGEQEVVRMIPGLKEHWRKANNGQWECVVAFILETLSRRTIWGSGEVWGSGEIWGSGGLWDEES